MFVVMHVCVSYSLVKDHCVCNVKGFLARVREVEAGTAPREGSGE